MGEATHFLSKTIYIKKRGTFSLFSLFLSLFFLVKLLFPKTALLLKMAPFDLVIESLQNCQSRESTYWCISGTTFREWRERVGSHYVYGFLTVPNFLTQDVPSTMLGSPSERQMNQWYSPIFLWAQMCWSCLPLLGLPECFVCIHRLQSYLSACGVHKGLDSLPDCEIFRGRVWDLKTDWRTEWTDWALNSKQTLFLLAWVTAASLTAVIMAMKFSQVCWSLISQGS